MSLDRALVVFPGRLEGQEPGSLEFERHVGELEGDALELADLLAELDAVDRPLLGVIERALGAADAGGGDLQPRGAEPGIGDLEALVHLAQDCRLRHAAIGEFENAVVVAAMRDIAVAVAHHEARMALVDEEGGDELLLAARRVFLARGGEQDDEVGDIGMADEMLGAVDDEVIALLHGRRHFMPRTSEPAPGSVMARQSDFSPRTEGKR